MITLSSVRRFTLSVAFLLGAASLTSPAGATMLDYHGYEQLFGEPVTASAIGKPLRQSESPVNIDIITAEEIQRSGARTIPEVLDRIAGVQTMRTGQLDQQVSIRGIAQGMQNRILVLINNRQVYLDSYGYTPWHTLPVQLDEIQQIEVVRGPNTALYGFNAAAGVINIVTINPLTDERIVNFVEYGTTNSKRYSGVFSQNFADRVGIKISLGGENVDTDVDPFASVFSDFDEELNRTASGEVRVRVTDRVSMAFDASYAKSEHLQTDPFGLQLLWHHEILTGRASLSADTNFGLIDVQISHSDTFVEFPDIGDLDQRLTSTIADVSNTVKVTQRDTVRIAAQYRRIAGDILNLQPGTQGEVGYDGYATSIMWNRQVTDRLSLTAAGRYDYLQLFSSGNFGPFIPYTPDDIDRSISNFGWSAAAVYKPTDFDTFRLSASRGASLPSILELGAVQLNALTLDFGEPNAKSTQITNFELGYEREVEAISSTLTLAAFYQRNEDLRNVARFDPNGGDDANYDDLDFFGAEVTIEGGNGPFSWGASYSYLEPLNETVFTYAGVETPYDPSKQSPRHEVEARFGFKRGSLTLDAFARYRSEFENLRRVLINPGTIFVSTAYLDSEIEEQFSFDLQATYELTDNLSVSALAQQVNDDTIRTGPWQETERRAYFGVKATF